MEVKIILFPRKIVLGIQMLSMGEFKDILRLQFLWNMDLGFCGKRNFLYCSPLDWFLVFGGVKQFRKLPIALIKV